MKKIFSISGAVIALGISASVSALEITTTNNAATLSDRLFGSGVTIDKVTYSGHSEASGTFTGGAGSIGIESGIILTTGYASDAVGPNSPKKTDTRHGLDGHSALESLIGISTHDAASLTVEFTTSSDDIFFNFVLASEEYDGPDGWGQNDAFALFLDNENLAFVTGTDSTPVTVANVNNFNENPNSAYFNDNGAGAYDIEYDGFTDIFTASLFDLSAGKHTLEFVIADGGWDNWIDSAVFIQSGTLSDESISDKSISDKSISVPAPTSIALLALGLIGLSFAQRKGMKPRG